MADVKANKPQSGAWDNISNITDKKQKIKFELGVPVSVQINSDKPREVQWEDGVFYVFDVLHAGNEEAIVTSAWSLLRSLKEFEPLNGKLLKITKLMEKGKQVYHVEEDIQNVRRK